MKQDRPETFTPWDAADYIQTVEDAAYHLEAASEEDGQVLLAMLGDIARSESMSALAREAGIGRASIYRILTGDCNPTLDTLLKITRALRLRLKVQPVEAPGPSRADAYTYRVVWSTEEPAYLGLCVEYPELSFLDSTPEGAFAGIRRLVSEHVGNVAHTPALASDKGLRTPTA